MQSVQPEQGGSLVEAQKPLEKMRSCEEYIWKTTVQLTNLFSGSITMFSMKQQNFYLIIWRSCFNHSTTPIVNMHLMHCSEYWSKVSLSCCSCFSWLVCEHCEPSESEQIRIKITIGQIEKNFRALPIFCPNCACDRNSRETRDTHMRCWPGYRQLHGSSEQLEIWLQPVLTSCIDVLFNL